MKAFLTIKEIKEKLEKKEFSTQEVTKFYLDRLKKYNKELNAILEIFENPTTKENKTNSPRLLEGIPGIAKDNICQKGRIASCASKILQNYKAPYDATVIKRIKNAGGVLLGRGNMDEFAMGASGEYSAYGATKNPWDKTRVAGGSSAGPAAAVAAGLVPWALGSETGGSIRLPSSFCNLVGLYPTYGTNSRYGLVAFASSTDQVGPLTKTVYDNALVSSAISWRDHRDSTSLKRKPTDFTKNLTGNLPKNFTIGVIKDSIESEGVDDKVKETFKQAITQFEKLGAKIKYISIPHLKYGISVYFIISRAEAASNLARFDGSLYGMRDAQAKELKEMYKNTRENGFGAEVKRRILMGNYVLSTLHKDAFYNKANQIRAMIRYELETAFTQVDLLTSPTTTTTAFEIGKVCDDPLKMYMADYFNVCNCVTGNPSLSFPSGFTKENLPVGCQFIGPRFSEELMYQAAYAYEQNTDHHLKNPKGFE